MPRTALVLAVVFGVVACCWRSAVQYRRTGDAGLRGVSHDASALERLAGALFLVGVAAAFLAPVCVLRGLGSTLAALDRPLGHAIGLVLATSGIALTVAAQRQMGASWRVGVDPREATALVRHGLFARVRNPIFSGMLVAMAGLLLLVPSLVSAIGFLLLVVAIELQVRGVEEPYLLRTHAEAYRSYGRSVGRFVPGVGRFPGGPPAR